MISASNLPALGCRERRTGDLVAWILTNGNGSIGMLHTVDSHRSRGLAQALVRQLLPLWMHAGFGCPPFAYITPENQASMAVFGKLGFSKKLDAEWLGLTFER